MSDVVDLDTKKNKIHKLLKEAAPAPRKPKWHAALFPLLIASLIGTMLPHQGLNTLFTVCAILSGLAFLSTWRSTNSKITLRGTKPLIVALIFALQLAGCSGAVFSDLEPNGQLRETLPNFRVGSYQGLSVLGVDIGGSPINQAMKNGQINKLFGYSEARGYGLICFVKVKAYGT